MSRNILSIDVGTSTVKAMVFADDGEPCAESRQATPLMAVAAGRAEADMDAIWQAVQEVVRNLPAAYRAEVAGVSLSGISCGAWLVDGTLRPVRSAILWNDGRAAGLIADWQADGRLEEIFRISGNVMFPGYTVPLLRWMKDNEPDQLRRAAHVLCCKDWVRLCMTGRVATDPSDASYMPWDLARRAFSPRLLELCGVADLVHLFPPAIESEALAGLLLPAAAEALGVSAGIAVATGLVDVAASSLGAGVVEPGQACTILGTSCLNSIVTDRCPLDGPAVGIASATVQGRWLRSQVNTAGTMNLDWLIREFWRDTPAAEVHAAVERAAASVPVGARGVLFHPYLNTAGVLSPFVHPHARAQLFGLSVEHGRDEVARAVLEGV
ncbi:MAG: FGGY family carbohydrate kinase, partial [Xanthobacteraceae bacterium]